jgi:ribosomal protein L37AE/L43A
VFGLRRSYSHADRDAYGHANGHTYGHADRDADGHTDCEFVRSRAERVNGSGIWNCHACASVPEA